MKRALIRACGVGFAGVACFAQHAMAAKQIITGSVSGKAGYTNYTGTVTYPRYTGFENRNLWANLSLPGCVRTDTGITGCVFDPTECYDRMPVGGGTGTGTGSGPSEGVISGKDTLYCTWYKCMFDNGTNAVPGCNGGGACNATGMWCEYKDVFTKYGLTASTGTWDGAYTSQSYKAAGCVSGWYLTANTAVCNGTSNVSSTGQLTSCCAACPGMKDFNSGTATATTYTHNLPTNSSGGYSWYSPSGYGITSCIAFPPRTEYNDGVGTYSITGGCPYKA